jgi:hypothetical protein
LRFFVSGFAIGVGIINSRNKKTQVQIFEADKVEREMADLET